MYSHYNIHTYIHTYIYIYIYYVKLWKVLVQVAAVCSYLTAHNSLECIRKTSSCYIIMPIFAKWSLNAAMSTLRSAWFPNAGGGRILWTRRSSADPRETAPEWIDQAIWSSSRPVIAEDFATDLFDFEERSKEKGPGQISAMGRWGKRCWCGKSRWVCAGDQLPVGWDGTWNRRFAIGRCLHISQSTILAEAQLGT